jgi:surface antigen
MAFSPRLDCPKKGNPFYTAKKEGGLNPAIARPDGSKLIFQNCVFYAIGRFAELWGIWLRSTNAENFVTVAREMGLTVSKSPAEGAIAVWSKGTVGNAADGAGHVAVVEIINRNDIVTSESGWGSKTKAFWTQTRRNDGNWGQKAPYHFLGFIHPPSAVNPIPVKEEKTVVIRKGDKGDAVKKMQTALASKGYLRKSEIDGDFGRITLGAVLAFQFENGLEVDGICGSKTQAKLF